MANFAGGNLFSAVNLPPMGASMNTSAAIASSLTNEKKKGAKKTDLKEKKANQAPKKVPEHPRYADMITAALEALNDRSGSSRQAIVKYIIANYKVDEKKISNQLRQALKRLTNSGVLKQVKGAGASGSFVLSKFDTPTVTASSTAAPFSGGAAITAAKKKTAAIVASTKTVAASKKQPRNGNRGGAKQNKKFGAKKANK